MNHQGLPEIPQLPGLTAKTFRWVPRCKNNNAITGLSVFDPIFHDSNIPLFHFQDKSGNLEKRLNSEFV
jgi:hypothetical protein